MIERIRKASSGIVAKILFLLLALSFVFLWGGQDGLRMIGMSRDMTVANVGNRKISIQELRKELGRSLLSLKVKTGQDISFKQAVEMGFDREVLEKLINDSLIALEAEQFKIAVSDDYVVNFIKKQAIFLDSKGDFSKEVFDRFIRNMGFVSEKDYVSYLKRDILRSRVISALTGQIVLPSIAVKPVFQWQNQMRTFEAMVIDANKLNYNKSPSREELREYYGKNTRQFIDSERRTFDAVILDLNKAKVTVSPRDVDAIYKIEKNTKYKNFSSAEAKKIIKDKLLQEKRLEIVTEKSNIIFSKFEDGDTLSDIAKEHKFRFKSFKSISLLEASMQGIDQEITKFAFQAETEQLTTAEESKISKNLFFIVYVHDVVKPKQMNFDEAMHNVKKAYVHKQKMVAVKEMVTRLQNDLSNNKNSFLTTASLNKLSLTSFKAKRDEIIDSAVYDIPHSSLSRLFMLDRNGNTVVPVRLKKNKSKVDKLSSIDQGDVDSFLFVKVAHVEYPQKLNNQETKEFKNILNNLVKSDIVGLYHNYLRSKYNVVVNKKYFAS